MASGGTSRHWRRRVAALVILAATLVVAGCVYLVGYFSDFSGQHRVPMETTAAAAVILVVGLLVTVWILRTPR
jgi:archaellum component FlaF (FlaF/FlaG flagellin family)